MADEKKTIGEKITDVATAENLQKYVLGTKKNGQPRALYDILKDFTKPGKKKGKKKKHKKSKDAPISTYEVYLASKKKKKKKKSKHWHI